MKKLQTYTGFQSVNEDNNKFRKLLPKFVLEIASAFKRHNVSLYVVGGAVRDFLLSKTPKDFDLATNAEPNTVTKIIESLGYQTIPVGEQFGVIVAVDKQGEEFEIATFRKDLTGGRRPESVEFTDIKTDVKRRDLTVNALFYDIATNQIVDLVDGKSDLMKGIIRTVGKPKDRFLEDPLRKLRAIRFFARMGKSFNEGTKKALLDDTDLKGVSPERIYQEFKKGVKQAKNAGVYVQTLYEFGYLEDYFPKLYLYTSKFIEYNDRMLQAAWLLQNNDTSKIKKQLNKATWTNDDIKVINHLITLKNSVNDMKQAYRLIRAHDQLDLDQLQVIQWVNLFDQSVKDWVNFIANFDLSQIDMEKLLAQTDHPSEMPKMIQQKIEEMK